MAAIWKEKGIWWPYFNVIDVEDKDLNGGA